VDILSDVLNTLRLRSAVYCRVELRGPWSLAFAQVACASFHVIEQGGCWLQQGDEDKPLWLERGDLVLLSQGCAHQIASDLQIEPVVTIRLGEGASGECRCDAYGLGGEPTTLICGTFDLAERNTHPLLSLMPPLLLIRSSSGGGLEWLDPTLRFFAAEALRQGPGSQTMLRRLADMLFIQVVRAWIEDPTQAAAGWIGALRDKQIGQAIGLIHNRPNNSWKVADLASAVSMSRSAFSSRFSELVGESPIQYLTRWRMQTAARLLSEERLPLMEVASQVGYDSEAAFSKAFKRIIGVSPSAYRRSAR
jgi:AraC-like DNA-binding protein